MNNNQIVKYGILVNSKFSDLRMKNNVRHMSTYSGSAYIYAQFKITDNFFAHLWPDVSNHKLDFSLELKNRVWFLDVYLGFHKPPQEEITRGKIARSWWPSLIAMQGYHSSRKFFVE